MKTLRAPIMAIGLLITTVVVRGQVRPNGTYNPGNLPVTPSVYVPQVAHPTVALPDPVLLPRIPMLGDLSQTNSPATTNRVTVWRPTPIMPVQPQTLIANQLRRPSILSPPPLLMTSDNVLTNQAIALPLPPPPASTNTPVRLNPWQGQNPLLRDVKYHW